MRISKQIGGVAAAALIVAASLVPGPAEARNGRVAAGAFAGFAAGAIFGAAMGGGYWGPYPYYYGYPAPIFYPPGPYYGPYGYYGYGGCAIRTVWTGRRWRHVRVCY